MKNNNPVQKLVCSLVIGVAALFSSAASAVTIIEKNELKIVITPDHYPIIWMNAEKYGVDFTFVSTSATPCSANCSILTDNGQAIVYAYSRTYQISQYITVIVYYDANGKIVATKETDSTPPPPPIPPSGNDANDCSADESQQSNILSDYIVGQTKIDIDVTSSGASQFSVPIVLPPSILNMAPDLSINYNSVRSNGLLGQSVNVNGLSVISRCRATDKIDGFNGNIGFNDDDRFCLDGKRLIAVSGIYGADGTEYRTEIDNFQRIYSRGQSGNGPAYFEIESKSGHISFYGNTDDSAIEAYGRVEIKKWAINRVLDASNNHIDYLYAEHGNATSSCTVEGLQAGEYLPCRIEYGGNTDLNQSAFSSVAFNYEEKPDVTSGYVGDTLEIRSKRIRSIQTFSEGMLVRSYRMSYKMNIANNSTQLTDIQECDGNVIEQCKRPIHINWNAGCTEPVAKHKTQIIHTDDWMTQFKSVNGDFNGDGFTDLILVGTTHNYFCAGPDISIENNCSLITMANWKDTYAVHRGDYNDDGYADIYLFGETSSHFCAGPGITAGNNCIQTITADMEGVKAHTGDFNGDGYTDMYFVGSYTSMCPGPGIAEAPFTEDKCTTHIGDFGFEKINIGDYNGDGYDDVIFSETEQIAYGSSIGLAPAEWSMNSNVSHYYGTNTGDFNGDGYDDLYILADDGGHFCPGPEIGNCTKTLAKFWDTGIKGKYKWALGIDHDVYPADYNGDGRTDLYIVGVSSHRFCDADALINSGTCTDVTPNVAVETSFSNQHGYPDSVDLLGNQSCVLETLSVVNNGDNIDNIIDFGSTNTSTARCMRFVGNTSPTNPSDYLYELEYVAPVLYMSDIVVIQNDSNAFDIIDINGNVGLHQPSQVNGFPIAVFNGSKLPPGTYEAVIDVLTHFSGSSTYKRYKLVGTALPKQLGFSYQILPGDYNGNGITDLYMIGTRASYFSEGPDNSKNITTITDSLGNTTKFEYKTIADTTVYTKGAGADPASEIDMQLPMTVVSKKSISNSIGEHSHFEYQYAGAKIDRNRGFLGFAQQIITDQQKGITTTTSFNQVYPYIGRPATQILTKLGGSKLSETTYNYLYHGTIDTTAVYPYLNLTETKAYDLTTESLVTTKTTNSVFDNFGNLINKVVTVVDDNTLETYSSTSTNTYDYVLSDNWKLKRLITKSEVFQSGSNGTTATITTDYEYDNGIPTIGLLTKKSVAKDSVNELNKSYSYDSFGNMATETLSGLETLTSVDANYFAPRTTTTVYEPKGRFPYTITNDLNHVETHTYDAKFGVLTDLLDINNLNTHWDYDSFGRAIFETRPDNTSKETRREWNTTAYVPNITSSLTHPGHQSLYAITTKEYSTDGVTEYVSPQISYYNSHRKEIRKESISFDGTKVYVDANYDKFGRNIATSRAYFDYDTGSKYPTRTSYDLINRVSIITSPTGAITETSYNGLSTTTKLSFDGKEQVATQVNNAIGQIKSVTDANLKTLTYTYANTLDGRIERTIDPHFNTIEIEFDALGRKIRMNDPDMGEWHYGYNALGEQRWLRSPKHTAGLAQYSNLNEYDTLGRLIKRTDYKVDGSVENNSSWLYDTLWNGALTSVISTQENGFSRHFTYDALGRTDTIKSNIQFSSYVVDYGYSTTDGRLETIKYPTGFEIKHNYNSTGYLYQVVDAAVPTNIFWQGNQAIADGQLSNVQYGNGVEIQRGFHLETGLIDFTSAMNASSSVIQFGKYGFDSIGNLISREDMLNTLHETFTYDSLNRLENITLVGVGTKTMQYDDLGNIINKPGVGAYTYKTTSSSPHAVESIAGTINTSYTYDANGNIKSGDGRTIEWTSFDKPRSISKGGETAYFYYDADHNRTIQNNSKGLTVYLNPNTGAGVHYEKYFDATNSTQENRHYIYAGNNMVAVHKTKTGVADKTDYLLKDHLGSTEVVTDSSGAVVERLSYTAFGELRNVNDWQNAATQIIVQNTTRGYTGHEQFDDFGLVHMNGRIYDPKIGRFLSADPIIQAPTNLQSFNRYSYVLNNPLSFTDPTGYTADYFNSNFYVDTGNTFEINVPTLDLNVDFGIDVTYLDYGLTFTDIQFDYLNTIDASFDVGAFDGGGAYMNMASYDYGLDPVGQYLADYPQQSVGLISFNFVTPADASLEMAMHTVFDDVDPSSGVGLLAGVAKFRSPGGWLGAGDDLVETNFLSNIFPDHPVVLQNTPRTLVHDDAGRYWLQSQNGNRITPSGSYNFVTLSDGTVRVARPNINPEYSTHLGLSGGMNVRYAGELQFYNNVSSNRGNMIKWSNNSGHYQPPSGLAPNANLPMDRFIAR